MNHNPQNPGGHDAYPRKVVSKLYSKDGKEVEITPIHNLAGAVHGNRIWDIGIRMAPRPKEEEITLTAILTLKETPGENGKILTRDKWTASPGVDSDHKSRRPVRFGNFRRVIAVEFYAVQLTNPLPGMEVFVQVELWGFGPDGLQGDLFYRVLQHYDHQPLKIVE